jgi:REP element-mobilizing transposase RayT
MAARRILYERGSVYHISNAGAQGEPIARDERDLDALSRTLRTEAGAHRIRLLAWCVLPHGYQLLVQPLGDQSISEFLQRVFNSYAKRFNRRHARCGALFAGPYRAERIDDERRLALLCRRVHLLPVTHGCADAPERWPHSNYDEWIDEALCLRPLRHLDAAQYARFVSAATAQPPTIDH